MLPAWFDFIRPAHWRPWRRHPGNLCSTVARLKPFCNIDRPIPLLRSVLKRAEAGKTFGTPLWILGCCIPTKRQRTQTSVSNKFQTKRILNFDSYCRNRVILRSRDFSALCFCDFNVLRLSETALCRFFHFCNFVIVLFGIASVVNRIVNTFRVLWKTRLRQKHFARGRVKFMYRP